MPDSISTIHDQNGSYRYRIRCNDPKYRGRLLEYAHGPEFEEAFRVKADASKIQALIAPFVEAAGMAPVLVVTPESIIEALQSQVDRPWGMPRSLHAVMALRQGLPDHKRWNDSWFSDSCLELFKAHRSFADVSGEAKWIFINTFEPAVLCHTRPETLSCRRLQVQTGTIVETVFHEVGHALQLSSQAVDLAAGTILDRHYEECFAECIKVVLVLLVGASPRSVLFTIVANSVLFIQQRGGVFSHEDNPLPDRLIYETTRAMLLACEHVNWIPLNVSDIIAAAHYGATHGRLNVTDRDYMARIGTVSPTTLADIEGRIPDAVKNELIDVYDQYRHLPHATFGNIEETGLDAVIAASRKAVDHFVPDAEWGLFCDRLYAAWKRDYDRLRVM